MEIWMRNHHPLLKNPAKVQALGSSWVPKYCAKSDEIDFPAIWRCREKAFFMVPDLPRSR